MTRWQRGGGWGLALAAQAILASSFLAFWSVPHMANPAPAPGFASALPSAQEAVMREADPTALSQIDMSPKMAARQKKELKTYRFNKMKEHGEELAKLARSLQEDLEKSNVNILSLKIVEKAQKIEKLAKQIQDEAREGT